MRKGAEMGAAGDGRAVVVAFAQIGLARVKGHAYPQRSLPGPGLLHGGLLERAGGRDGAGSVGKDGPQAAAFPLPLEQRASLPGDRLGRKRSVFVDRLAHRLRELLPQSNATLNIAKQKRNGSGW